MADLTILGAGSWGTALAYSLAKNGKKVKLWGRVEDKVDEFNISRENTLFLPGVILPEGVEASPDLEKSMHGSNCFVLAVPSHIMRSVCSRVKDLIPQGALIINVAKGLETPSLLRMSEVIAEELRHKSPSICVLSGPSHAEEVGRDLPTALVAAAKSRAVAEKVQDLFMSPRLRVYTNPDMVGVELGGALKNVIALGTGMADGLGFGDNTKAALMTRGLSEIARLGLAVGANPLTFAGLTGVGDLIVTCTSMHSRNRRAGIQLGKGVPLEQVLSQMGMVVEGVKAAEAAWGLCQRHKTAMPICQTIYGVLYGGEDPRAAVVKLMGRDKTHEVEDVANWLEDA